MKNTIEIADIIQGHLTIFRRTHCHWLLAKRISGKKKK